MTAPYAYINYEAKRPAPFTIYEITVSLVGGPVGILYPCSGVHKTQLLYSDVLTFRINFNS